jgi:hypothetical protein
MNKELQKIDTTVIVNAKKIVMNELSEKVNAIIIDNDESFGKANDLLTLIKKNIKEIEIKRKTITQPYRNFVSAINEDFKEVTSKADEIKDSLSVKIIAYNKILEDKRKKEAEATKAKELAELKEAQEKADLKAKLFESPIEEKKSEAIEQAIEIKKEKPVEIKRGFKTTASTTSFEKFWNYEITDPELVPKNLCSPDPMKIRSAIKDGMRMSFGLNIFEDTRIKSR